jgi:hypothetical protein
MCMNTILYTVTVISTVLSLFSFLAILCIGPFCHRTRKEKRPAHLLATDHYLFVPVSP